MQINGEKQETQSNNLEELLTELGFESSVVATAINGEFVPHNLRNHYLLTEGDQVEILAPMQGG